MTEFKISPWTEIMNGKVIGIYAHSKNLFDFFTKLFSQPIGRRTFIDNVLYVAAK